MSAEKEIVNFWYNQHGYFTITNLKSKGNRDLGIIALRFENEKVSDAVYADVSASISGSHQDASSDILVNEICRERFGNPVVRSAIESHLRNLPIKEGELRHAMVLGNMPRSRKEEVIARFAQHGVSVIELEEVMANVMNGLDTQYYKNDVIRTLQLMKYLLLSDPKKMAQMLSCDMLNSTLKDEFINLLVSQKDGTKAFRNADESQIAQIIKNSKLRNPMKLAQALQSSVLNNKTRKPFVDSLMKQKGMPKPMKVKKEMSLRKFF